MICAATRCLLSARHFTDIKSSFEDEIHGYESIIYMNFMELQMKLYVDPRNCTMVHELREIGNDMKPLQKPHETG